MNAVYEVAPIRPRMPSKRRVEAGRPERFDTHYLKLKRHFSMEVIARAQAALAEHDLDRVHWRRSPNTFGVSLLMPNDTDDPEFADVRIHEAERAIREGVPSLRRDRAVEFDHVEILERHNLDLPRLIALIPRAHDIERFAEEQQKIREILADVVLGKIFFSYPVFPHLTLGRIESKRMPSKKERNRMRGILKSQITPLNGVLKRPEYQYFRRGEKEEVAPS